MLQQSLSLSFLLLLSLIMSSVLSVLSDSTTNSTNIYVQCSQLNFTSTTTYDSNVESLFTSLMESASLYNFNKVETSPQNDGVYGLFQCRGDLTSPNCKDCVANAVSQLRTTCPTSTGGQIQLEGCFVKFDNTSFFGAQEKTEVCKRCGPSIGYNSDILNRVDEALAYLVGGNGQYFRGGDFGSIQGVAQCVQDLSLSDCEDCLSEACGRLRTECETATWGDMYLGKCYIRYADQGNENIANNGGNSSPHNKSSSGGGGNNNIVKWIGYIIAAVVGAGSLTFAFKNCCNINVYNKVIKNLRRDLDGAKKEAETAKSEAKSAKEKAEKAAKEAKEANEAKEKPTNCDSMYYLPYGPPMPMPPPCPYLPHSNPNTCYYL